MATGLLFQPPKFDWHIEDQQITFQEWKDQITLALEASSISREKWYTTIVIEGFKQWNTVPISKQEENKKNPNEVFKAITNCQPPT